MVKKSVRNDEPKIGRFLGFDHVTFYVGNAKQAASYYTTRFGFQYLAYQGLETGNRDTVSHVVSRGGAVLVFKSSYTKLDVDKISDFTKTHGDGVKDVSFTVSNARKAFDYLKSKKAKFVTNLITSKDPQGTVQQFTIKTKSDMTHTFI